MKKRKGGQTQTANSKQQTQTIIWLNFLLSVSAPNARWTPFGCCSRSKCGHPRAAPEGSPLCPGSWPRRPKKLWIQRIIRIWKYENMYTKNTENVAVFQLFAGKDQPLLLRRDPFLFWMVSLGSTSNLQCEWVNGSMSQCREQSEHREYREYVHLHGAAT